jgi:hypothetical protein
MMQNDLLSLSLDTTDDYFKNSYDFNKTGTYTIAYMIEDDDGNIYTSDTIIIEQTQNYGENDNTQQESNISITSGWNLLSLPLDTTISYSDIPSKLPNAQTVWTYSNGWKAYGKSSLQDILDNANIDKIVSIDKEQGFWVNSAAADTLEVSGEAYDITASDTLSSVSTGWHLLGSGVDILAETIANANSSISTIWIYNNGWKAYGKDTMAQTLIDGEIAPLTTVSKGQGFWVNVK